MVKSLRATQPEKILIRSTNWIGDAIMTTPAVRTVRENFPHAAISLLTYPWVADVFAASPHIDEIILYHKAGKHKGPGGLWRLAEELAALQFDMAILLQNAFEAALIARLAGIPVRAGYKRDGRSLLLTHGVKIDRDLKRRHQVFYYQGLMAALGLSCGSDELFLPLADSVTGWARQFVGRLGGGPVIGINPGAAYGPAKRWPAERYGELAALLHEKFGARMVVFGTESDTQTAAAIKGFAPDHVVDLAGKTKLAEAMALIGQCDVFVTNDSGLMHVGAALKTPLVAIFGSTDPVATGPFSENAVIIRKDMDCSPCLKTHCRADFKCMIDITVAEVAAAVEGRLAAARKER